jgi:voltage-gated potassium channel
MPRTIEIRDRTLRDITLGQDSYILLFLLLVIDYLSLSLVDSQRWGGLIHIVPVAVSVMVGLHTSGAHRRTLEFAAVVLSIALIAAIVQVFNDNHQVGAVAFFLVALLLAMTGLAILGRILRHRHVSIETMFGAVCVYILIGLFFSSLFIGIALSSAAHHLGPFLAQPGPHNSSDYVYLSFVTLTTVGFGDLTPYTDLARSVVVLEALIGQIFLVTLVARLVTLFGLERPQVQLRPEEDDQPPSEIYPDPFEPDDSADPSDP